MSKSAFSEGAVVAIGECMVELARAADGRFGLAYGGDTFNSAVYLARAGVPVEYLTRLGDDPYSAAILAMADAELVGATRIRRIPSRMPGLYMIETSAAGERTFWYWRDRSPARELFDGTDAETIASALAGAGSVYFSGVTLSLYDAAALDRFHAALVAARSSGIRVVMDSNYRPRGWAGDADLARSVFRRFWSLADIALPTFDDEQALWGDADPAATAKRLAGLGVGEVVVKNGEHGALVWLDSKASHVPCPGTIAAVDTTAAGDSFNAAYLAARIGGRSPAEAALAGHRLAGVVIQHRGAIVPRAATEALLGGA